MSVSVRKAEIADLPAALDMAAKFYETTEYEWPFCRASVESLGAFLIQKGIVLIAERDGRPVGLVALVVAPFPFNNAITTAAEVVWWVDPAERGTGAGMALFRAIAPAAEAEGAKQVEMIHLRNSPEHAGAIYKAAGYAETHTSYTKVL